MICYQGDLIIMLCKKIDIEGIVQGVGFRPFVFRIAQKNNIKGYVKNKGGRVEIVAEGNNCQLNSFIKDLKNKKPINSKIDYIKIKSIDNCNYNEFLIHESDVYNTPNSILVSDIGICKDCINELLNINDRRYKYPFISCTNCGPRYTLTKNLPYDRKNTSLNKFETCDYCNEEYINPTNRRFHAETICCEKCGPNVYFLDKEGALISKGNKAIKDCCLSIDRNKIIAVKGYGGFHLVCDAFQPNAIELLRNRLSRLQQPFAIMVKNIDIANQLVELSHIEKSILESNLRPIVILNKKQKNDFFDDISPGLHNVGVMLPYSGLHQLLFEYTQSPAYIMTSANISGLPMAIDSKSAIDNLSDIVDNYLTHNITIENRVDDSVIRCISDKPAFIRRSRGYVPTPLKLPFEVNSCVGVGAELSNTLAFAKGNKAYISQHIGNTNHFETTLYHREVFSKLSKLSSIVPKYWGCDLHPLFNTSIFAKEKGGSEVVSVQHHYSHVVSLMIDANLPIDSNIIGIALDGVGYGADGTIWGGEILKCSYTDFIRCAHLKPQLMPGGDLCSYYPERMVLSMLKDELNEEKLLELDLKLKYGFEEHKMVLTQLQNNINTIISSSSGRVLDAAAALLGISRYRSYQGEPSMKLESAAKKSCSTQIELPISIHNNTFDTSKLLYELYLIKDAYPSTDLAYAYEEAFAKGIAKLAIVAAKKQKCDVIGLTGGVAYNEHIVNTIKFEINQVDLQLITHNNIPCGDGGVCLGQAIVAGLANNI